MTENNRPNPDALLSAIQQAEARRNRGKLKIFLGMCAGVGKTYSMLQDARQRLAEGMDVAAAIVETHQRVETESLLKDLPIIPLREIIYRGVTVKEMDLDSVLARRPEIVLVDELAHTNAPGSRHPKRYQDVLEFLEAGISVYTTLNIQHVESRVDAVAQITSIRVGETVPDSILDRADEIQLVDLTPEKLRERLKEGKVYLGEKAATAADNFFREENLTALREIVLRLTAEHVGQNLREVMELKQISGPWKTNERAMVAVSPSPYSERLIRWTRRVATGQNAPWVAVYIETSRVLNDDEKARLAKNLSLARQLGAEVVMTTSNDVVAALLRVAREYNVTQIIVGKTIQNPLLQFFRGGTLINRLIKQSGEIDIHVVRSEKSPSARLRVEPAKIKTWTQEFMLGTLAVAGITLACWLVQAIIGYWSIALVYLVIVLLLAYSFHRPTIIWVATLSALSWNYLFIPPQFTFHIGHLHDLLMFLMYYIIALIMGQLTSRLRIQEKAERGREQRTRALYRIAQGMAECTTLDETLKRALAEISELFASQAAILLNHEEGKIRQRTLGEGWTLDEKEQSVAAWAFLNNQVAGRFTDTLPESTAIYFPLHTAETKTGVLAVRLEGRKSLSLDERVLLEAMADQLAVMIERFLFIQKANRTQLAEESEKLYKVIFDSVSHELKTPLSAIMVAAENLNPKTWGGNAHSVLAEEIQAAARRLRRTIENLLGMSRIESGRLKLEMNWCEIAELIMAAREQSADMLAGHKVRGTLGPELPLVKLDFGLMVHAISNLLANAALYSPPGSEIKISAHMDGNELVVKIADEGPGISEEAMQHIFDKFYRGSSVKAEGSGLGLAIVQGLVRAHGGIVTAANNPEKGATFTVRLPVNTTPLDAGNSLP